MTSVADELASATSILVRAGVESARHDAETLLAWVLSSSRSDLLAEPDLSTGQLAEFRVAIESRASRVPLQHITGTAAFRYLELEVGPGVFVPRPETEAMAGSAVAELERLVRSGGATPRAVDLCTGSGAVALAMATEVPQSWVSALEVSPAAHAYAVRNAARLVKPPAHEVDVRLGDIADGLDDLAGRAHVVTANPPYIPLTAFESVAVEARDFDPPEALWSGEDGLDAIRAVAVTAAELLVDGGLVVCEHADVQGESAPAVFAATGKWTRVRDHHDLAGRPRFISARRVLGVTPSAGTIAL